METQISNISSNSIEQGTFNQNVEFSEGAPVVYALHGRCNIVAVQNRQIGSEQIRFYKLEKQKSPLSRSQKNDPAIWIPVSSARAHGLRSPMTAADAEAVIAILTNREYYFPINEPWSSIHPQLETCIKLEGSVGLAKVASYMTVLKKRQIVATSEVARFHETVWRLLMKELSEVLGKPIRIIEHEISKGLRQKLLPDN